MCQQPLRSSLFAKKNLFVDSFGQFSFSQAVVFCWGKGPLVKALLFPAPIHPFPCPDRPLTRAETVRSRWSYCSLMCNLNVVVEMSSVLSGSFLAHARSSPPTWLPLSLRASKACARKHTSSAGPHVGARLHMVFFGDHSFAFFFCLFVLYSYFTPCAHPSPVLSSRSV